MAKTVPLTYTDPGVNKAAPGEIIFLTNLKEISDQTNYLWSRRGMITSGRTFDPPFETTSLVLTVTDEGPALVNLDTITATGRARRVIESGGVRGYRFLIGTYMRYCLLECKILALDTGATLTTATIQTVTGDSEGLSLIMSLTEAEAHEGSNLANPKRLLGFVFRANLSVEAQTGRLWYIAPPREAFGTASLLPTS